MAQGEFTKDEASHVQTCLDQLFDAVAGNRKPAYVGQYNDVMKFLEAAGNAAPDKVPTIKKC